MEQSIETTIAMQVRRVTPSFQLVDLPEMITETESTDHYDGGFTVLRSAALRSELLGAD